jgi:hypothetical protein
MSLENDVKVFLRKINKELSKYSNDDLFKVNKLLKVESIYLQYYIKKITSITTNIILIEQHKRIITDYIKILETKIKKEQINKFPELYYLIIAYLRIISKDDKILLKSNTKFINVYINSLRNKKPFNNSLNMIELTMEIIFNLKKYFSKEIQNNSLEFSYVKELMKALLINYEELTSSSNSENSSYEVYSSEDEYKPIEICSSPDSVVNDVFCNCLNGCNKCIIKYKKVKTHKSLSI